jgi:uncharacterized surface protein with fasciclin (FAS1) repeats
MKLTRTTRILSAVLVFAFAFAALVVPARAASPKADEPSIVDIAVSVNQQSGEFSTLIAALKAAGLVKKFDTKGNFTVFAPTDAAFAKLGLNADNIGSLPKARLAKILGYHVARGDRFSGGVVGSERVRMSTGDYAKVRLTSDGAFLDNSRIVTTDINAGNGVIHIIDNVLLPPME